MLDDGARCLGGEAEAPVLAAEPEPKLAGTRGTAEIADAADEAPVVFDGEARLVRILPQPGGCGSFVQGMRDIAGHPRNGKISGERHEGRGVAVAERAQPEPFGAEFNHCPRVCHRRSSVNRPLRPGDRGTSATGPRSPAPRS